MKNYASDPEIGFSKKKDFKAVWTQEVNPTARELIITDFVTKEKMTLIFVVSCLKILLPDTATGKINNKSISTNSTEFSPKNLKSKYITIVIFQGQLSIEFTLATYSNYIQ